jgi:hypothetical protein
MNSLEALQLGMVALESGCHTTLNRTQIRTAPIAYGRTRTRLSHNFVTVLGAAYRIWTHPNQAMVAPESGYSNQAVAPHRVEQVPQLGSASGATYASASDADFRR